MQADVVKTRVQQRGGDELCVTVPEGATGLACIPAFVAATELLEEEGGCGTRDSRCRRCEAASHSHLV